MFCTFSLRDFSISLTLNELRKKETDPHFNSFGGEIPSFFIDDFKESEIDAKDNQMKLTHVSILLEEKYLGFLVTILKSSKKMRKILKLLGVINHLRNQIDGNMISIDWVWAYFLNNFCQDPILAIRITLEHM